ncbi:MAG: LptF/LptG family permease [Deltaproteobacteria bacterium]|nr:LptF/LptG family permease [Candidatus Anaeroferrophillacea bacterium]
MRLLHRYVAGEIVVPFGLALGGLVGILLLGNLYKMADLVVTRGAGLPDVGRLMLALLPYLLTMAIPMAFLFAVMIGIGRLGSDGEVTAFKALGIAPRDLLLPVLLLGSVGTLVCLLLELWLVPAGMKWMQRLTVDLVQRQAAVALEPGRLSQEFAGLAVRVAVVEPDSGRIERVVIIDQREADAEHTITARRGRIVPDLETGSIFFLLEDGVIHTRSRAGEGYQLTDFGEYRLNFDIAALLGRKAVVRQSNKSLTLTELRAKIAALRGRGEPAGDEWSHVNKRFALPVACLVFALLGLPLALEPVRTSGRFRGFVFALFALVAYYIVLSLGQALGEEIGGPLAGAVWLANLFFGALGGYLFYARQRERELVWLAPLNAGLRIVTARLRRG